MSLKSNRKAQRIIRNSHQLLARELDRFQQNVSDLFFNGKSQKKNLPQIRKFLRQLETKRLRDIECEDAILFNFLEIHVPRLGALIKLLRADHLELKRHVQKLHAALLNDPSRKLSSKSGERICSLCSALICLIRNSLQVKKIILHDVIEGELHQSERDELFEQMLNTRKV